LPQFELPLTLNLALDPLFAVEFGMIRAGIIQPSPVPRGALKRTPVWQRLSDSGAKTAVVRFPFTYPATEQADYVISNRTVVDLWDMVGVREGQRSDLVSPSDLSDSLLATFSNPGAIPPDVLKYVMPKPGWPKPSDSILDPLDVLRRVVNI